eukprot:TRINITY_DN7501_c0_g1_i1.p1 TRINITY_DN7501_c0_g1~~TRINITY_DN7501_c0_g1_i1.p1  ORF type:complete len:383 (+),score=79.24 TRINITY_DN7501_c0_g1_i1:24-1172(+)
MRDLADKTWLYIFSFIAAADSCKSLLLVHKKWLRMIYQHQDLWRKWFNEFPWFIPPPAINNDADPNKRMKLEWNELFLRRVRMDNNWKKAKFTERRIERGHTLSVSALHCDDHYMVTGSYDESIKVWDIANGTCVRVFQRTGWVSCLQFREYLIIAGSNDGFAAYRIDQQRLIKHMEPKQTICTLKFQDNILVTSTGPSEINTVYDLNTFQSLLTLPHSYISCMSLQSNLLLAGSLDGVALWDLASAQVVRRFPSQCADGVQMEDNIVAIRIGQNLNIIDLRTCEVLSTYKDSKIINSLILHKNKLLSGTCAGGMKLWDMSLLPPPPSSSSSSSASPSNLCETPLFSANIHIGNNNVAISLDTNWERIVAGFWNGDISFIDF